MALKDQDNEIKYIDESEKLNIFYVYEWFNVDTGEVFYVGKGKGNRHKSITDRNQYFKNYYKKYKKQCQSRIILDGLSESDSFSLEKKYIKYYKEIGQAKCNLTNGGEGSTFDFASSKAKELYYAIILSGKANSPSKFSLSTAKQNAINKCMLKHNILSHLDIFNMSKSHIENVYRDYIDMVIDASDDEIAYEMFTDVILESYGSMDEFWESNI